MRRLVLVAAALIATGAPSASEARLRLGARAGYGFAAGEAGNGVDQSDLVRGQIPLQLDVSYGMGRGLTLGAYFSYARGILGAAIGDDCDARGASCSASVVRTGLVVTYDLPPFASALPWLGLGIGYEWAELRQSDRRTVGLKGWELASLQAGADWALGRGLHLGPFVSWSLARYDSAKEELPTYGEISDKGMHQLLQLGLRGRFSF